MSLGIISLLLSILPFYGILAILPALIFMRMVFKSWPMIKKFTAPNGITLSGLICSLLSFLFLSVQIFAVGLNQ